MERHLAAEVLSTIDGRRVHGNSRRKLTMSGRLTVLAIVWRSVGKAPSLAGGVGLLFGLCVPWLAYAPISPRAQAWQVQPEEWMHTVSGSFKEFPLDDEKENDTVVLKNGDSLSGSVVALEGNTLRFFLEMAEREIRAPVSSLSRAELKKRAIAEKPGSDEIGLVDGGRFRASVQSMDGKNLFFRTVCASHPTDRVLAMDKVSSIALDSQPLVLLDAGFDDNSTAPFIENEGEWVVYRRQLLQSDPGLHGASAHTRVQQRGRLRYSWTLLMSDWGSAGVYFLASASTTTAKGTSYRLQLEHNRLAVFKTTEHGETINFSRSVARATGKIAFKVEYDCETGRMRIWSDGQQVANLRDKSPITWGEYLILRADGRAAFDDLRIEQFGGDIEWPAGEEGKDVVILRNADRIGGSVKQVSDAEVVLMREGQEGEVKMDRSKVLRIVFERRARPAATNGSGVVFWNEDMLTGRIVSLADGVLAMENGVVGELRFDLGVVKAIMFEE